jgi:hypothetical protein
MEEKTNRSYDELCHFVTKMESPHLINRILLSHFVLIATRDSCTKQIHKVRAMISPPSCLKI